MKFAVVLFCLFAYSLAGPIEHTDSPAALLKHEEVHGEDGYSVEFELDDGTLVKEHAKKAEGPEGEVFFRRTGSYKYQSPEGEVIEVHYTADENGFRAEGDHLPKVVV